MPLNSRSMFVLFLFFFFVRFLFYCKPVSLGRECVVIYIKVFFVKTNQRVTAARVNGPPLAGGRPASLMGIFNTKWRRRSFLLKRVNSLESERTVMFGKSGLRSIAVCRLISSPIDYGFPLIIKSSLRNFLLRIRTYAPLLIKLISEHS